MNWVRRVVLANVPLHTQAQFPEAASEEEISSAERHLNMTIDGNYKDLLRYSNGPMFGGIGGQTFTSVRLYGFDSYTNRMTEQYISLGAFVITTDGCGGDYCLMGRDQASAAPVAYFDPVCDSRPAYFVASGFQSFLSFWCGDRGGQKRGWPFDRALFERFDPDFFGSVEAHFHPWNVD